MKIQKQVLLLAAGLSVCFCCTAWGQFPGMDTNEGDKSAVSDKAAGSEGEGIESESTASRRGLAGYWDRCMGVESPYRLT